MVLDAVSNFVRGNTDAAVGTSDTTVSVVDASIFPDPATDGEFNVVIWDVNNFPRPDQDGDVEIMRVTGRDTDADELTVERGQETTSDVAHPEGSAIHLSPTAKMFSDIESTFGDFWDAGTQELTADVNNTNTTTEALEADDITVVNGDVYGSIIDEDSTSSGDDLSVTVPDIENYRNLLLQTRFGLTDQTTPEIVIDGDDADGNYHRVAENSAPEENQDTLTICEGTDNTSHIVALIELTTSIDVQFRPGITHAVVSEGRDARRFENPIESGGYGQIKSGSTEIELRDLRDGERAELIVRGVKQ